MCHALLLALTATSYHESYKYILPPFKMLNQFCVTLTCVMVRIYEKYTLYFKLRCNKPSMEIQNNAKFLELSFHKEKFLNALYIR